MSIRAEVDGVSVVIGRQLILDEVSLSIEPGEFVTMLGPSGSGKTTTLNVIAGFAGHCSGHVRFDGEVVDKLPPHQRDLGIVFQGYALFPHMTLGQNVGFPLEARKMRAAERRRRVEEALALVELPGMYDRKPSSLSGGQQQRVALARALVFNPRLLLLDEPLAALDKRLREAMQVELKRIQREVGVTTVAVTHDQTEALTMSDRVAIMHDGRLEQVDAPEALYWRPKTRFVAQFLGEANLLEVDDDGCIPALATRVGGRARTAVLRPESIELSMRGGADEGAEAVVEAVSFQGSRFRVSCRPTRTPEQCIVVSVSPHASRDALQGGATVRLRANAAAIHTLDAEPDAEAQGDARSQADELSRTA